MTPYPTTSAILTAVETTSKTYGVTLENDNLIEIGMDLFQFKNLIGNVMVPVTDSDLSAWVWTNNIGGTITIYFSNGEVSEKFESDLMGSSDSETSIPLSDSINYSA